jgi:hypothetical protein
MAQLKKEHLISASTALSDGSLRKSGKCLKNKQAERLFLTFQHSASQLNVSEHLKLVQSLTPVGLQTPTRDHSAS